MPAERSIVSGATTSTPTVTPMRFLTSVHSAWPAAAPVSAPTPARRSTRTVRSSIGPDLDSTHWKCGDSAGSRRISSSIWVGNRFTPRRMIMSSVRPVIFSMRRIGRAVPGSSRVRSRVR